VNFVTLEGSLIAYLRKYVPPLARPDIEQMAKDIEAIVKAEAEKAKTEEK